MAYQQDRRFNNGTRGYNQDNRGRNNREEEKVVKISQPLKKEYSDSKKLFLEDGVAYKLAKELTRVPPHQLRKILDEVKKASISVKADPSTFNNARDNLYYVVPLTAYNAGRMPNLKPLYNFVFSHINDQSITDSADIVILDKLVTSVVAYHKLFANK